VEQVRFAPQAGKYKVYIVDEVHMLSTSAFNAFLKTLEEPPSYAIFILATTEKHKILPTILSRCQIFDFKRITNNDTVEHLQEIVKKEDIKAEKAALQVIAQKSEGCMRDALSILDKIVSFTNGEVTYQNTLEHLNILDHDYYFKLLNSLLQQDLAAALLLYDEINRKGFEGDIVLNGFAEFLRNLLVCTDEKAAMLLDVVEGMQPKYIKVAKEASLSFLVSSLNILNETEINYKMARNKRLHVEMAIIKLNFLQQAIELSMDNGNVVKKKRVDAPIAYRIKEIQPLQVKDTSVKSTTTGSKFLIEQPKPTAIVNNIVSEPAAINTAKSTTPTPATAHVSKTGNGNKKSLLDGLRQKYGDQYLIEEIKEAEALDTEKLKACWEQYAQKMDEQQKHSAANAFRMAKLTIETDNTFTVSTSAITQQKFMEGEKTLLIDFIQQSFNNRSITFKVLVEAGEQEVLPAHLTMNSRQRFEKIAEQYPWVKELKDRLKLELDY
ncbi:MAG: DNA polymerase III subunit gamma/tau, partial [Panacibacter sp.]